MYIGLVVWDATQHDLDYGTQGILESPIERNHIDLDLGLLNLNLNIFG